jgi:hypothetical protein
MALHGSPGQPGLPTGKLPHEFVFPSGRTCRTFDELVQACQEEWTEARRLLSQGVFAHYLTAAGRMDLATSAQKAQAHTDPDIGLHIFTTSLPASKVQGPRLDLKPRRLILGAMKVGEKRPVTLTVSNVGKGLLHGTITLAPGSDWLRLKGSSGEATNGQCALKTSGEQQVLLEVDTSALAAKQSFSAKLTVVTNGGIVDVPVSLDLAAVPFARGPFQGASSPREMAERMRAQPRQAAPFLESGEVTRWFNLNGWTYPVPAATAKGVAAVQQFFEGMGLSKPPPLALSETEARFLCQYPEVVSGKFTLRTPTKKWVYATVESSVPWVRVTTPNVSGPQLAPIAFDIDSSRMGAGSHHETDLQVLANAGQRLQFRVVAEVRRPEKAPKSWFPGGGAPGTPAPPVERAGAPLVKRPLPAVAEQSPAGAWSGDPARPTGAVESHYRASSTASEVPPGSSAVLSVGLGTTSKPLRPRVVRPVLVAILLALCCRLLLAGPGDLYARVLAAPPSAGGGSLDTWVRSPLMPLEGVGQYIKHFCFATWWLGAVFGAMVLWHRGSRWGDVLSGIIAGGVAGLLASATGACLLPFLDLPPRYLLQAVSAVLGPAAPLRGSPWVWTFAWVLLAVSWWAVLGGAAGALARLLGERGFDLLANLAAPAAWLAQIFGMKGLAAFFALGRDEQVLSTG